MEFVKLETACGRPLHVYEMPHAHGVANGILVDVGTRDEDWQRNSIGIEKEAGLAHAFEHMVFQGNREFPTSVDITAYLEGVGGDCNAWTDKETTVFYNMVPAKNRDRSLKSLYNMVSTPLLREENIVTEMQNVIQEINRYKDNPATYVDMILVDETIYGDHPLAKCGLGTPEAVAAFTRDDFLRYHERFYHPGNYTFLAAGNVNADLVRESWDKLFADNGNKTPNLRASINSIRREERVKVIRKEIDQVHICLGAPIGAANERSTKALKLFTNMIGGGMSFPLFQEVRDKRGLCYHVNAETTPRSDLGRFNIYVGTDPKRWREAVKVIFEVVQSNMQNETLFQKAKRMLIGKAALTFDSPARILEQAAQDISFEGTPLSPKEIIEQIESIGLQEVTQAAEKYLSPENFVQAFIAPKDFEL
jgi:predicted Zn-dependent peptidase